MKVNKLYHNIYIKTILFLIACVLLIMVMQSAALALEETSLILVEDHDDILPMQSEKLTAINEDCPLVSGSSDEVIVNYAANSNGSYEWYYSDDNSAEGYCAYIAGNSGQKIACVSNIAITVNGTGSFSFDYMTSTYKSGDGYALYYKIGEPVTLENYTTAVNYKRYASFRGEIAWTEEQFNIKTEDLDDDGKATVFIAYVRTGNLIGTGNNTVAVANACFTSGEKTLTINIEDNEFGYVKDSANTYPSASNTVRFNSGDTVILTAVPKDGARFYGWVDGNGRFLTSRDTYSFAISQNTALKAIFNKEGRFVARRNDVFYTNDDGVLIRALSDAHRKDIIVMLEDQILPTNATVPSGAKLYIPYGAEFDIDGYADGVNASESPYCASKMTASSDKAYRTLTINDGATLTVDGALNIGGVIGYPSQYYQGHTSGWHGRINNEGKIVVKAGGAVDCWGFIVGKGIVTAENGATVYEPFIVCDYAGAWNTEALYSHGQSPFKQYAMQNIQTRLVSDYGSKLYARCNLWAGNEFHKTDAAFIGENGLFQLGTDSTVTRIYDAGKYIGTNDDIGKTTYIFDGGMKIAYFSMTIEGMLISTKDIEFPIPYNTDIILENGDYYPGRIKIMPGAAMTVGSDANLFVDKTLFVMDGLIQSDMSGKSYPDTKTLQSAGFSASGQLFVKGSMTVEDEAIFGGTVRTDMTGGLSTSISIKDGAVIDSKNVSDGAIGEYDVNSSVFDLPARAFVFDPVTGQYSVEKLIPGVKYSYHDSVVWMADDYTMTYAVNCPETERSPDIPAVNGKYHKWETVIVPLKEERVGSWVQNFGHYTFYQVTFKDNDGRVIGTQTVEKGSGAIAPADPVRTGYSFTDWDVPFDNITADLTVTARYSINRYTITFDSDGGSNIDAITVDYGTAITTPADPTKEGYIFNGWDPEVPATMPAKDIILKAKWKTKNPPTGGGGGGGGAPREEPQTETAAVAIASSDSSDGFPILIEGSTATLLIKKEGIDKILGGRPLLGPVSIDFSSASQKINSVNIPAEMLKAIGRAGQNGNTAAARLNIILAMGIVEFDDISLNSISDASGNGSIKVLIDKALSLTNEQKASVKGNPVYDIRLENDRGAIDFDGNITIYLPCDLEEGQTDTGVVVYYIDSGGNLVNMNAKYDPEKKMAYFTTTHLSLFMVDYDSSVHICPGARYVDVDPSLWYHEAVDFAIEKGLFAGTGDSTFEPNTAMSRAMLATVIWRLEGKPVSPHIDIFKDVRIGSWYTEATAWAIDKNLFTGYGNGMFGPDDNITREQMAVIMHRYAMYKGYDTLASGQLTSFSDEGSVSDWALEGMEWAVSKKLIMGVRETLIDPGGNATRAQVAAIIMRFITNIVR